MGLLARFRAFLGWPASAKRSDSAYEATFGNGGGGGFAGGAINRLTVSLASWSQGVNADLDAVLTVLRARGRQMAQSNGYGRRFLTMVAANIVGAKGPLLQVRATMASPKPGGAVVLDKVANDAIEVHWARWCKHSDITGRSDFAMQCRMAAKAVARDGEALVRLVRRADLPYGIALQLLEADRLDDQINMVLPNGGCIRQGVELDSAGRPLYCHLRTKHPGERYNGSPGETERVPVSQLVHLFLPERAEQVRGYTWFHAVIFETEQLRGFKEAAVVAARVGASKVAAIQERSPDNPPPSGSLESAADAVVGGNLQMSVEAGEMFQLPPGYELASWNPEYPHANFESFVKAAMRGISAGLDVATHNLSGDMTDVNYSSARIAELAERDQWVTLQAWFIRGFVEPVYHAWLEVAMLRGDITFPDSGKSLPAEKMPKFRDASRFLGRRWSWVDPAKEIAAAKEEVALGLTSRTRLAAERGVDFDDILEELKQESEQIAAAGLVPVAAAAPAAPTVPEA